MGFEAWVFLTVVWLCVLGFGGIVNDLLRGTPLRSKTPRPDNRLPAAEREALGEDWTEVARDWFDRRRRSEDRRRGDRND